MLHRAVLLRRVPADLLAVLAPNTPAPRQVVVDLDKVVVARIDILALEPPEETQHSALQLLAKLRHVARRVDLAERHADLVLEAPEAGEQDRAREQVVLPVLALDHDGEVVLHEARAQHHGVLGQRALVGAQVLAGPEVADALGGALVQRRVAGGQVGDELVEELEGGREGFGGGVIGFGAARGGEAAGFVGVVAGVVRVELDPVVDGNGAQAHGYVVFGAVAESAVGEGFGLFDGPVGVGWWCGCLVVAGGPFAWNPSILAFGVLFWGFGAGAG